MPSDRSFDKLLLLILIEVILYTVIFSYMLIWRYNHFALSEDVGETIQAIHTTAFHGLPLYEAFSASFIQFNESRMISYLTVHFSPILFTLVPFYRFIPKIETLLVLKALITALSAIPAYLIARKLLGSKYAFIATTIYLMHPHLHSSTLANWPPSTFIPLLMLFAIYYYKKRSKLFWLFLILSLCTHEFTGILLAMYFVIDGIFNIVSCGNGNYTIIKTLQGLIRLFREKGLKHVLLMFLRDRWCSVATILSLTWGITAWMSINLIYPRIAMYTLTPLEILMRFVSIQFILTSIALICYACAPFVFLPLKSWYILSLLPFALWAISFKYIDIGSIGWPQGYYYLPLLYIAFIDSLRNAKKLRDIIALGLVISLLLTPLNPIALNLCGGCGIAYSYPPYDDYHITIINNIAKLIPENAAIVIQSPIAIAFANRLYTYIYMPKNIEPEYIIMDFIHPLFRVHKYDQLLMASLSKGYGVYAYADGVLVLKRGYKDEPLILEPLRGVVIGSIPKTWHWKIETTNKVVFDSQSQSKFVVRSGDQPLIQFGPYMPLMKGTYQATFRIKIEGNLSQDEPLLLCDVVDLSKGVLLKAVTLYGKDIPKLGEYFNVTFLFSSYDILARVEFRSFKLKKDINVYLDYIEVKQIDFKVTPYNTSLSPMYFGVIKGRNELKQAIHNPEDGAGTFVYGPNITLPPGCYTVKFKFNVSAFSKDLISYSNKNLMIFDVYVRGIILTQRNFTLMDFNVHDAVRGYETVTLRFCLENITRHVEFRIHVLEDIKVIFYGVDISQSS